MISVASSIKFRKADGLLSSFDNKQFNDATFKGVFKNTYFQKIYDSDTVTIQVKVKNAYTVDLYYSLNCWGVWTKLSSGTKVVDGTSYYYWKIDIDLSTFAVDTVQFKLNILNTVPAISETWDSEPLEILSETDEDLLQIEFFNLENAFEVDYVNGSGLAHLLRVEGTFREYRPGGEISVFDNQSEVTKIKDEVKRILILKTEPIPAYLCEMLRVAMAMDKLFINEVEFVADSLPEVETQGNLCTFICNLIQRNVIGLNTHDVGFDCDSITSTETMQLQSLAASGQISFTVPDDYLVLTITGQRTAGSPTITAGTTVGGTEVLSSMELTPSYLVEVAITPVDQDVLTANTLYVEISGVGATANIFVLLVKNRQT